VWAKYVAVRIAIWSLFYVVTKSPHIEEFQITFMFYILLLIRPKFYDVPVSVD
jgi:hypothetical protein